MGREHVCVEFAWNTFLTHFSGGGVGVEGVCVCVWGGGGGAKGVFCWHSNQEVGTFAKEWRTESVEGDS